jgi:hypothetical protein
MATASNGSSTIALLGTTTFFTMGIATGSAPSLISYGVLHQQPRGIVSMGSDFLVMWSEIDTVSGIETLRAAFVSPEGVVRNAFEVGRSLATSVLPLTTVGGDALVLWYDDDQRQSRGGIIHPDGSVVPVKLGGSIAARAIVPPIATGSCSRAAARQARGIYCRRAAPYRRPAPRHFAQRRF